MRLVLLIPAAVVVALAAGVSDARRQAAGRSTESAPRPVLATANVFGAGYGDAPGPGGGGGGTLPPGWRLPPGSSRVVTFPSVTGTVTPIAGEAPYNGPQGDGGALGSTDVESWRGISGILDSRNGVFLVGVFLGEGAPALPAPPRLDFTDGERFDRLEPLLGQTFFIGDGRGRAYVVPENATRLYLGFADGYFYRGRPGWYANNAGRLEVVATGVLDGPEDALDTSAPELHGARNMAVTAPRGNKRARARFFVYAADAVDGTLPVTCTPRSGSFFKLGRTQVSCSATDSSANTSNAAFTVTVKRTRK